MQKRRRIRTVKEWVALLSELYNVSLYIAQKFYNKANGVVSDAKQYLLYYTWDCERKTA